MAQQDGQDRVLALLAWWQAAGVDYALDDAPTDWSERPDAAPGAAFHWPETGHQPASPVEVERGTGPAVGAFRGPSVGPASRPATPAPSTAPGGRPRPPVDLAPAAAPTRPFTAPAPDAATAIARAAARTAPSLEALEAALAAFDGCGLKATAKSLCFYRGSPSARIMVVGEAPGRDEDLAGKPFVGRAGQLLDRMLAAIDLGDDDVHITNIVYWRPPGNRTPTPQEAQVCRPFLDRQIELVAPDIMITLGGPAAKAILDVADGILKVRGRWRELDVGGRGIRVMPTLHPAYLLRTPAAKREAWRDLLAVKAELLQHK